MTAEPPVWIKICQRCQNAAPLAATATSAI
jgi:hypothetical protein